MSPLGEPPVHKTRKDSDLARRCSDARRAVLGFLDWAGCNDSSIRARWEQWATDRAHAGATDHEVSDHVKARWIEHRRSKGLPIRIEAPEARDIETLVDAISKALGGA